MRTRCKNEIKHREASFMRLEMEMAEWEREGMKTPHLPISRPHVADHLTLLTDPCFCIVC